MYILLDIDGVMVPAASWKPLSILSDGFPQFSSKAVLSLRQIIAETGASIVLTTSHKSRFTIPEWEDIFRARGIEASIRKLDDNLNDSGRKTEILNWLGKSRQHGDFVIIDDDKTLNALPAGIKEKFILTRALVGLCEEDAVAAIDILKSPALTTA